jgi:acetyl-CoA acetyltransferase
MAASIMNAAMAIATGHARCVVAFRGLAQGQFGRFGQARGRGHVSGPLAYHQPYGMLTPGQMYGLKFVRWMHEHGGVGLQAQKAVSLASYGHAQRNPRATMYGKPITAEDYDNSRYIVEPWRLYDFCLENDGAAAIILVPADRASDLPQRPVYILAAAQGAYASAGRAAFNESPYASAGFPTVAQRLWADAELGPPDVDVVQSYENFTGGVVMSLVEHGFCAPEAADESLTLDHLSAPHGRIPLNTSGGNLAEAYIHGFNLAIEAVRQLRGTSTNQVPDSKVALVSAGPLTTPVSSLVLGTEESR